MAAPIILYTPTSCGGATYIAAHIAGLIESKAVEARKVDIYKKVYTSNGESFLEVNPKGNVPTIKFACGTLLNEGAATLQWIADQAPASGLAPAFPSLERYKLINDLNFLASEFHASFGPLFNPANDEATKAALKTRLATKWVMAEGMLGEKDFLGGAQPNIADLYLYVMIGWAGYVGFDTAPFPKLLAFRERVGALPKVAEANAAMAAAP